MKYTFANRRTALVAVLAFVLVCCLIATGVLTQQASAYSTAPEATIDELYSFSGNRFNAAQLQQLLKALVDEESETVTMNRVREDLALTKDGQAISSKNIIVELGGIKWIAVYVSLADTQAANGYRAYYGDITRPLDTDVVLTLWQAEATETAYWNEYQTNDVSNTCLFPSNMYGTSYMRAVVLNNGGKYATEQNTALSKASQEVSNTYAKFNMAGYTDETGYRDCDLFMSLVAPRYVAWQKDLKLPSSFGWSNSRYTSQVRYSQNNEAWGKQGEDQYFKGRSYEDREEYDQWMNDLVWLPAISETGFEESSSPFENREGLWQTTLEQKKNSDKAWLRTALCDNSTGALMLDKNGDYDYTPYVHGGELLVRPAIHLNLSVAVEGTDLQAPTGTRGETKTVYNGQEQSLALGLNSYFVEMGKVKVTTAFTPADGAELKDVDGKQVLTATKPGTYKVTAKPSDGYWWTDGTRGNAITFTLTIAKRKVSLDIAIPGDLSSTVAYGTPYALANASKYWSYTDGTVDGDAYVEGATYKFIEGDEAYLSVLSPASNSDIFAIPGVYPLYLQFVTDNQELLDNYEIVYHGDFNESGEYASYQGAAAAITVTQAQLDVDGFDFEQDYVYGLTSESALAKSYAMQVPAQYIVVAGGQVATVTYANFTTTRAGAQQGTDYSLLDGVYTVWNAAVYTVDVTITAPHHQAFTHTLTITIGKAQADVKPVFDKPDKVYTATGLPKLDYTATLDGQQVTGTISWITPLGSAGNDGEAQFTWRWTPDNDNIEVVEGEETFYVVYNGNNAGGDGDSWFDKHPMSIGIACVSLGGLLLIILVLVVIVKKLKKK